MPFFEFRQNNSYGSFRFHREAGISVHVIIEADSAEEANMRAEAIGLYFDGVERGIDCLCCGDRWDAFFLCEEGDPVPSCYGIPIEEYLPVMYWMGGKPEAFIHYKDGRIVPALGAPREEC